MFDRLPAYAEDPILGLFEAFKADPRDRKINLGIGIYCDEEGRVPVLASVRAAQAAGAGLQGPSTYLPTEGGEAYRRAVRELVFGEADAADIVVVQTVAGTGALKAGADLLKALQPDAAVWMPDPTWANHAAIFGGAGLRVESYPYYDKATGGFDLAGALATLRKLPAGSVVLLHPCCHNPTGVDPSQAEWHALLDAIGERGLLPFFDMAYQGFAQGVDEDAWAVRECVRRGVACLVASSFSKIFSLYGERVGALSVVASSAEEAGRLLSQLKRVVRTNYSNPPVHGGKVVATVLATPELRQLWEEELATMRVRIKATREAFVQKLKEKAPGHDFDFVREQVGMFSYSGLTKEQVASLREQSIYAVDTGRICVAALNSKNIDVVVDAIAKVL